MKPKTIISLYDYTGEALKPWAKEGYECLAFDIQHKMYENKKLHLAGGGSILYIHADLYEFKILYRIYKNLKRKGQTIFGMAFPPCTDLAVSGAAHFKKKREADPKFQSKAVHHVYQCSKMFEALKIPYFIENPVSVLATKWRKPDYSFHPYEYGGYIPEDEAEHPQWPEYIPARDAYRKKTCLWTGNGFRMPEKKEIDCSDYYGNGYSKPMMKLGGKSMRTKNIRSATPRGFAQAVMESNR